MGDTPTIRLVDKETQEWRNAAAEYLRECADRVVAGDISELVVISNDRENNHFERFGHFNDRWRLLGAIEYAKTAVFEAE